MTDAQELQLHFRTLTDDYAEFVLENVDVSVANALRRIMIAEVPTIAIDLVEFSNNTTVLNDEFIAHRLGLVPLISDDADKLKKPYEEYNDPEDAEFSFTLDVKCTGSETLQVYDTDLVAHSHPSVRCMPVSSYRKLMATASEDQQPIVLVKMRRGQELKLKAIAHKGIGKDHAKWMPVATAVFQYVPEIIINETLMEQLSAEQKQQLVNANPHTDSRNAFRYDPATDRVEVIDAEAYAYDEEILRKAEEMGYPGLITVLQNQRKFLFKVEGTGALRVQDVVQQALGVLRDKLETMIIATDPEMAHEREMQLQQEQQGSYMPDGMSNGLAYGGAPAYYSY